MTTLGIHGVTTVDITDRIGKTESGEYRGTKLIVHGKDGITEIVLFSADIERPLPIEDLRHFDKRVEAVAESLPKVDYALFAELVKAYEYLVEAIGNEDDFGLLDKVKAALGQ